MLQSTCDAIQQPIRTLPSEISTWIKYTPSGATSSISPSISSASNASTTSVQSNPSDLSTTTNTTNSVSADKKSSMGTKIGVGVGVAAIAVLGLAASIFVFLRRCRRQAQIKEKAQGESDDKGSSSFEQKKGCTAEHAAAASELDGDVRAEMWSPPVEQSSLVLELPGDQEFLPTNKGTTANTRTRPVSELEGDGVRKVGADRYI